VLSQRRLKAAFYRGGTSKAVIFRKDDLPAGAPPDDVADWDRLFLSLMGSPDLAERQLDGMGGGISSLSKIAVISPSNRKDCDVDYTFAQVGINQPIVSYRGNCGNISSAVGPFAFDEGLISSNEGQAAVRIFNTNTGKRLLAQFEVENGKARVEGDYRIDGVSRPGSPIKLTFIEPAGAATGKLLPTGNVRDVLDIGSGRKIEASLVDVANPLVIIDMDAVSPTKDGFDTAWFQSAEQRALLEDVRVAASRAMGLVADEEAARVRLTNLPLVAVVRKPNNYRANTGAMVHAQEIDVVTQMMSMGAPHKASPLTGAICLAAACKIAGTTASEAATSQGIDREEFRIGHPSGVLQLAAVCENASGTWRVPEASVFRTARRLFEGHVLVR
jgi:hypothetical protein